jgi:hypothetical protein
MAPFNIRNAFVEQHLAERMSQISQYSFWQITVHRGSILGHKHGKMVGSGLISGKGR